MRVAPRRRSAPVPDVLPPVFAHWFAGRGWSVRPHQLALLERARADEDVLLIAPTGAGKTLAGFLPSLVDLQSRPNSATLHTLYISPLKALAVDVERNLQRPVAEMKLGARIETRTGDTSTAKRQRQRRTPPDILLTTPEQVALLLATPDARTLFASLRRVIFDELHAVVTSKRGDLLALDLARLRTLAPNLRATGLSATVRDPDELRRWLRAQDPHADAAPLAALVTAPPGAAADLAVLDSRERLPWAGHSARHAMAEIYERIKAARMTLVFVNTRAQAEWVFQALWRLNEDGLAIALHHGSLDLAQRARVEAAMAAGRLKAVVCTSTLDLGIDWGDVDLVVNVGAPKGSSRLMQRIGRSNHRLDEPSRAILVPSNRFEVMECVAAVEAARAGKQDTALAHQGGLDVLCQHILGSACAEPFDPDALFREVVSAEPYAALDRPTFDAALAFVATGGYALASYDRFAKIRRTADGLWRVANGRVAQAYRMNVGTIVEAEALKVRLVPGAGKTAPGAKYTGPLRRGGRVLGEIEESFLEMLAPADTFLFGGEVLALQGVVENEALVSRSHSPEPKVPSYAGGKFPLSTYLAEGVRAILADPARWGALPPQVGEWLELQRLRSALPPADALLVETFPRGGRHYLVCYPFEGRLAHQTLGMLLTRRMERAGVKPLGFVANDYALSVWTLADIGKRMGNGLLPAAELFAEDMLGDDLEEWLGESALMKRTFRHCALISGMIERNLPGREKTGRQLTISTDLIYDVLRRHEPDHILLRAARTDAATGLLDIVRLGAMLTRVKGRIRHQALARPSPLAVPILLEIGRESVYGEAQDAILAEAEEQLIDDAMTLDPSPRDAMTAAATAVARRAPVLHLAGAALAVDAAGALYWPEERLVVVADLHLEKGSSYARRGQFLPPYDTAATLARLTDVVHRYAPRRVVALGDSFHDVDGGARMGARDLAALLALQAGRDWIWIAGNHDPVTPAHCGGTALPELAIGALTLRHEPRAGAAAGEIAGHLHPVARVAGRAGTVRRRCLATDGTRCILPAFGAYAGGLNLCDPAFALLFAATGLYAHVLGHTTVYRVPGRRCLPE